MDTPVAIIAIALISLVSFLIGVGIENCQHKHNYLPQHAREIHQCEILGQERNCITSSARVLELGETCSCQRDQELVIYSNTWEQE